MIEEIRFKDELLALILPANYRSQGIEFFTPNDFSQQLGYMRHPAGKQILPHVHNPVARQVSYTKEVLFIRSGSVRVDFYSDARDYLFSKVLGPGDVVLLAKGGHGFEVLEEAEIIEVKQGPYAGEADKTRFTGIEPHQVKIRP